ncbi:MAG: FAD-dependent monooxygenase [Hyphomicrobiaceae bacterium]|nr:FAD-dependent monooxygenase [Hyphomicrobiaceae bacterium]
MESCGTLLGEAHPDGRAGGCAVAVVGTGLAGIAAALALADSGVPCVLIGPAPTATSLGRDTRTTALFGGSIELLRHVGVWDHLAGKTQPLQALRLIDATGALVRAPEVLFQSREIGLETFGYNVENRDLLATMWERAESTPLVRRCEAPARDILPGEDRVEIVLGDGSRLAALLVVGADGEASICRAAAAIAVRRWDYPQVAIATRFSHTRPHGDISTELHRRAGPMTTVPLKGNASSLVWVETRVEASRLMELGQTSFAAELQGHLHGLLGRIGDVGARARFPLSGLEAERLGARRVALVGEAAHRLPPIGAQGLNLGLRDVAWLAGLVGGEMGAGRDPGAPGVLAAYERARRGDVVSRTLAVDALNRALIADLLPGDIMRGAGLAVLRDVPWLRRSVMREGVAPAGPQPRLLMPPAPSTCGSSGP